jgi:hypothetical protein
MFSLGLSAVVLKYLENRRNCRAKAKLKYERNQIHSSTLYSRCMKRDLRFSHSFIKFHYQKHAHQAMSCHAMLFLPCAASTYPAPMLKTQCIRGDAIIRTEYAFA